jgi:ABC-type amino acid transport substrate-binding protein
MAWKILFLWCCSAAAWAAGMSVTYPANYSSQDFRHDDIREMLRVALDKTIDRYGPYHLQASRWTMEEPRALIELDHGDSLDVAWGSTSTEREAQLLPIRVDLRKGLLGYRIALIHAARQPEFEQIQGLADLQRYRVGQGRGWGDLKVYRAAGIPQSEALYESLYGMLSDGRIDWFPLSVLEVFDELQLFHPNYPALKVEQRLLFYYPWPYYFFCSHRNPLLADRLRLGLARMRADGSFDAIFWKYHRNVLQRARMKERRLIVLRNPLLPKDTPLNDKSMWFDPLRDLPAQH